MTRPVRFGVALPQIGRSWDEARAAAREFESLGYDSLWVCDHVFGLPRPELPVLEAWSLLAAVAAVTGRAELGPLVSPPYLRNPAVLAKQIATVDRVSNGRAIAGLGAGWNEPEFRAYGAPFPPLGERLQALRETCEILRGMWTEERFSYSGSQFRVRDAFCAPKPLRPPPLLIGGGGERVTLRIVAEFADVWNNGSNEIAGLARKIEVLRRHCDAVGRDFDEIEVSQQCMVVLAEDDASARASLDKAARVFGPAFPAGMEEHGIWGGPEGVAERLRRKVERGCTLFVMEFFGRDTREPARAFAEKVMPALRD